MRISTTMMLSGTIKLPPPAGSSQSVGNQSFECCHASHIHNVIPDFCTPAKKFAGVALRPAGTVRDYRVAI